MNIMKKLAIVLTILASIHLSAQTPGHRLSETVMNTWKDSIPIGSQTKWATFRHRLEERGFSASELAQVTCPIGMPGITGKQPEVIAVSVAAQLLLQLSAGKP